MSKCKYCGVDEHVENVNPCKVPDEIKHWVNAVNLQLDADGVTDPKLRSTRLRENVIDILFEFRYEQFRYEQTPRMGGGFLPDQVEVVSFKTDNYDAKLFSRLTNFDDEDLMCDMDDIEMEITSL
jgi:hypothetical protein